MPTYVFTKEGFLKFLEGHLEDNVAIIVSSDVTELKLERLQSHVGEKDYYLTEFAVSADVFELDEDAFDELPKYAIIFADKEELSSVGREVLR